MLSKSLKDALNLAVSKIEILRKTSLIRKSLFS